MTATPAPAGGWEPFPDEGFIDLVGPIVMRRGADGLRAFGFVAAQKHANLIGVAHGGMLMTLADRALGLAAWDASGGRPCVTIQFDMQFVSAVRMGDFVEIAPEVFRLTASLVFLRGALKVGERPVGAASGVWKILNG